MRRWTGSNWRNRESIVLTLPRILTTSYARGVAKVVQHPEVILCLERRGKILPVRVLAHAVCLGGAAAVSNGKKHGQNG